MKKNVALIEKLIRLANGETMAASNLKGDWFEQMLTDGILIAVTHGSRKNLRVTDTHLFQQYLTSQYDIRDLEQTRNLILKDDAERASQVAITGNSKFMLHRTFQGFLVNSYQPILATLNGAAITISPPEGCYLFIADYKAFTIPKDIVVIGIENAENFRYIERQKYLFDKYGKTLFVSRYPQKQSKDLIKWLQSISNRYVHFGDLDLAGIAIYQNEFYRYLGERASFLIPEDYEQRVSKGNRERYDVQLPRYGHMEIKDKEITCIIECIHRYHRGYDQEGYITLKTECN